MSHDTLIHRLVRPGMRALARTPVTPNHLTTLRLCTGLAAAAALACGAAGRPWGAGLFLASLLLDRADGELARASGRMSEGGYRYDLVADCVATVACFVGLAWGLRDAFGAWALALGVSAGASTVGLFWQINVSKAVQAQGLGPRGGRTLIDPDDAMAAFPVLLWLGLARPTLVLAGLLTPLVLGVLVWRARSRPAQSRTKALAR